MFTRAGVNAASEKIALPAESARPITQMSSLRTPQTKGPRSQIPVRTRPTDAVAARRGEAALAATTELAAMRAENDRLQASLQAAEGKLVLPTKGPFQVLAVREASLAAPSVNYISYRNCQLKSCSAETFRPVTLNFQGRYGSLAKDGAGLGELVELDLALRSRAMNFALQRARWSAAVRRDRTHEQAPPTWIGLM